MITSVIIGTIGTTVLVASVGEKVLVSKGKHIEADLIHDITKVVLGATTVTSFIWITLKLVKMFILGV